MKFVVYDVNMILYFMNKILILIDNAFIQIDVGVASKPGEAVLLYSQVKGFWSLQQAITPNLPRSSFFGISLAYSGDGILSVGASGYNKSAGAAFVYFPGPMPPSILQACIIVYTNSSSYQQLRCFICDIRHCLHCLQRQSLGILPQS